MNGETWLKFLHRYRSAPPYDNDGGTQRRAESETCQLANRMEKRLGGLLCRMDAETDGPQPCHTSQSRTVETS
jgi:hypothetical protein